ncbi:MAG: GNAT family N-acetyltransferase [Beijerinckiaceae bacterium]
MAEPSLARAIEERMLNAWPSVETMVAGAWLLRFANGYSKRANSATSLGPDGDLDDAGVSHVLARAAAWGIPAVVRLTPLCHPMLDARLDKRGFSEIEPTCAMIANLHSDIIDARVDMAPKPDAAWISANASSYGGVKSNAEHLKAILDRIRPDAAFATLCEGRHPVAWGIGVIERGMVGLQDIVVAPKMRSRGVGRALVRSLMAWGAANGAEQAYLHVLAANDAARNLYRTLGFRDAYRITHRVRTR